MKLWAKAVLGVAGLAAAGAGGGWYAMSGTMVTNVKANIERINAVGGADQPKVTLSYASIARTPFPTIGARVTDLSANITIPPKPSPYAAMLNDPAITPEPGKPTTVLWKHAGAADMSSNPWAKEYRLQIAGTSTTAVTAEEKTLTIRAEGDPVTLALKAFDRAGFNRLATFAPTDKAAIDSALADIAGVSILSGVTRWSNEQGEEIYSQQAGTFEFTRKPDEKFHDVDVTILVKDSLTTAAYDAMVETLMGDSADTPFAGSAAPFASSRAGKFNMELVAHGRIPKSAPLDMDEAEVTFSRFAMSNNFFRLSLPLSVQQATLEGDRILRVKLDGEYELTAAGGKELVTQGIPLVAPFFGFGPEGSAEGVEHRFDMLSEALPTLSTLGPVTLKIDLESNRGTASTSPTRDQFTLNALSLNHARWGIDAKGMVTNPMDTNNGGVTADVVIHCLKCDTLTADGFAKARAAQAVMNYRNAERAQWRVDEAFEQQVNALLAEIGRKDAATGDITLAITTPKPGNIQLNGKSVAEVMPKILAVFVPEAAAQMPAAGAMAPPEMPTQTDTLVPPAQ